MITMKREEFDWLIESLAIENFNEWKSQDNQPAIINEPPVEKGLTIIDPKSDIQVADENMPIDDVDWKPGNMGELGRAMKQMAGMVPETQMDWFYTKLRRLIDKAIDEVDAERMQPRLGSNEEQ